MASWEPRLSARYPLDLPAYRSLDALASKAKAQRLSQLFKRDPKRAERFSVSNGSLLLDYSKNLITPRSFSALVRLADEAGVGAYRDAMFAGEHINTSEDRAVLHVALRAAKNDRYRDGDQNCTRDVHRVLDSMEGFVNDVHRGRVKGRTGKAFTDIVNIGIGGSDLGIVMALRALANYQGKRPNVHCVSNVDGTELADLRKTLNPATTLFVVCSKTFTTQETMSNAAAARRWVRQQLGEQAVKEHFVAVSTNAKAMDKFGIRPDYRFEFWDWVGGRYSIWSAVGLSLALGIGMRNFRAILAGGRKMDRHFKRKPLAQNMPVIMAMLAVWYRQFFGATSQAILPYNNRLNRFPAFLQQLQMESNGKSVRLDGKPVRCKTGMVIWGESGNNAQHSFYQLLHQGTDLIPVDFVLPVQASGASQKGQDLAIANCLAQSQALLDGKEFNEISAQRPDQDPRVGRQRVHDGNRPSNTLVMRSLNPESIGQLIALYEHKVFVEGVIYGLNSFDQWGVELGKALSKGMEA
ncbi:MAG: glucose-6-phosphate isomerase, partial [Pseudomonadota bacterium]